MRTVLTILLLAGLPVAVAQDLPVQGPFLGYAWEAASSRLRPLLGIPGSSLLGTPLDLGVNLTLAEVSPRQDYALAVDADSGAVLLVRLTGTLSANPLPGVSPGASRIALSATGSAAAIYVPDRGSLQVITGLPDGPSVASVALPGPVSALAVHDSGDLVLAVCSEQLYALRPGGEPRRLGQVGASAAIGFAEDSHDALIADPSRQEVFLLRGENERLILAGARDGVSDPVAVALVGRRGFVANRGSSTVLVVDLAGAPPLSVACPCEVSGLQRLRGETVFRVTDSLRSASYLLEASPSEPRLWFVPPDVAAQVRPARERSR